MKRAFILGTVAALFAVLFPLSLAAPSQAATPTTVTVTAKAPCFDQRQRVNPRCVQGPPTFSEGGCGWFQRCVYFNRSEQAAIAAGSGFIIAAALCAEVGALCVVAGGIVAAAYAYLLFQRGGAICPTWRPRLRAHWFPTQYIDGCVD